jgi:Zn-dependent protease with chaperone function
MKQKLIYALFLLIAPVLALVVANLCEQNLNAQIRTAVHESHKELSQAQLEKITARGVLAKSNSAELDDLRGEIQIFDWMQKGSIVLILVAVIFHLGLWIAGRLSALDRMLLLVLFRPGFYLAMLVFAFVTCVNAALLIASIYQGESYLIGRVHVKIILLIGLAALVGVYTIIKSLFTSFRTAETFVFGQALTEAEHPRIWGFIRDLASRMGALPPEHIVVGLDPNFFVTEAKVNCLKQKLQGRTLYISAPLCRIITADQFAAVVGHELGHFKGNDTKFSKHFFPVYTGLAHSLYGLGRTGEGVMSLVLIPL